VAYGAKNIWEIYARIGVSDLKIFDAFSSTDASTTTNKNDLKKTGSFLALWEPRVFYPSTKYSEWAPLFREHTTLVTLRTMLWDQWRQAFYSRPEGKKSLGRKFRCWISSYHSLWYQIICRPYVYYSEAKVSLAANIPGLEYAAGMFLLRTSPLPAGLQESIYSHQRIPSQC